MFAGNFRQFRSFWEMKTITGFRIILDYYGLLGNFGLSGDYRFSSNFGQFRISFLQLQKVSFFPESLWYNAWFSWQLAVYNFEENDFGFSGNFRLKGFQAISGNFGLFGDLGFYGNFVLSSNFGQLRAFVKFRVFE